MNSEKRGGRKGSEVERREKKNRERERIYRKTREISGRNRYMYQWTTFSLLTDTLSKELKFEA